jgi:hypothetical protein
VTPIAAIGAVVFVSLATAYVLRVRGQMRAPLPEQPHAFDPVDGVRFLGTARVDGKTAGWPSGQLVADRDVILVRVPLGRGANGDLVLHRRDVRSVVVQGGRLSRRVSFEATGPDRQRVDAMRFGAALTDPAPVLAALGWPVESP